jgi:hypothetical protein
MRGVSREKPFIFYSSTQLMRPAERPHVVRLLKDEFFFELVQVQAFELAPGAGKKGVGKKGKANHQGAGQHGSGSVVIGSGSVVISVGGSDLPMNLGNVTHGTLLVNSGLSNAPTSLNYSSGTLQTSHSPGGVQFPTWHSSTNSGSTMHGTFMLSGVVHSASPYDPTSLTISLGTLQNSDSLGVQFPTWFGSSSGITMDSYSAENSGSSYDPSVRFSPSTSCPPNGELVDPSTSTNHAVPEPGTAMLFLAGGLVVFGRWYRRAS